MFLAGRLAWRSADRLSRSDAHPRARDLVEPVRRRFVRRFLPAVVAILGALGAGGCGTASYPSTLRVTVEDPSGLFAGKPFRVSIFDVSSGDTRDWAMKFVAELGPGEQHEGKVSSVETRAGGGGKPAKKVRAGLYLPDYRAHGWYDIQIEPHDGKRQEMDAPAIAWDGYGPTTAGAEPLRVSVSARANGKAWELDVTVTLASELPNEQQAVSVNDELTLELVKAAGAGDVAEAERLLLKGAEINGADGEGRTAVTAAAYGNHVEMAQLLVQRGADVNLKDRNGLNGFLVSTSEVGPGSALLVVMLNGGAKVAAVDAEGNTALIRAAIRGHVDLVRRLAVAGIAVSVSNDAGHTALEAALLAEVCADPYVETVEELIRAGADVNRAGVDGRRPKELALAGRCGGIVGALERAGAR